MVRLSPLELAYEVSGRIGLDQILFSFIKSNKSSKLLGPLSVIVMVITKTQPPIKWMIMGPLALIVHCKPKGLVAIRS